VQEIALLCTQKNPADRPTMRDVESMLEALSQKAHIENRGFGGMGRIGPLKGNGVMTKGNNRFKEG
jgi:hypothetical protein